MVEISWIFCLLSFWIEWSNQVTIWRMSRQLSSDVQHCVFWLDQHCPGKYDATFYHIWIMSSWMPCEIDPRYRYNECSPQGARAQCIISCDRAMQITDDSAVNVTDLKAKLAHAQKEVFLFWCSINEMSKWISHWALNFSWIKTYPIYISDLDAFIIPCPLGPFKRVLVRIPYRSDHYHSLKDRLPLDLTHKSSIKRPIVLILWTGRHETGPANKTS